MISSSRTSSVRHQDKGPVRGLGALIKTFAILLSLALPVMVMSTAADARIGSGFSSGSRGIRTFSPPPVTRTAPNAPSSFDRTITQPGINTPPTAGRGFFNRPGLFGGLAAGFLGAGLLGMLFGGGLFGGLGGLSSIFGLLIQIVLIVVVARFVMNWWQRRNAPYVGAMPGGPTSRMDPQAGFGQPSARSGFGSGLGASTSRPITIAPSDYDAFEKLLGDIQAAWSNEDLNTLRTLATPEMESYFTQDLVANDKRGVVNKVSNVKLLQGDLAEAWQEGTTDYATVAMRFSLVDKIIERTSGRVVDGSDAPQEVTEVWTFARRSGGHWELSAIQQA